MDAQPSANAPDDNAIGPAVGWFLLRIFLVGLGVILGAILALFIGLETGWLRIEC